jgi:hypothetical protein
VVAEAFAPSRSRSSERAAGGVGKRAARGSGAPGEGAGERNAWRAGGADGGGQASGVSLQGQRSASHFEVRDTGSGPVARWSSGWLV